MRERRTGGERKEENEVETHILFKLGVLLLGVDEVEEDIERAGEHKGEEQAEAGEIRIALCAVN